MLFEVINDKKQTVMFTEEKECIYENDILKLMFNAGYKFKLNGKSITLKSLKDFINA